MFFLRDARDLLRMELEELTIRAATPADALELARVRYCFRAELGLPTEDEQAFVERCAAWMSVRLAPGSLWRCWLVEHDGRVIGQAWAQVIEKIPNPVDEPELHAYITNCYVAPEARDSGLGGRLLETALAWSRETGVDAVILWPSGRSCSLYLRRGFAAPDDLLELRFAERQDIYQSAW